MNVMPSLLKSLPVYFMCVQGDTGLQGLAGPEGDPGDAVISHIYRFHLTALPSYTAIKKVSDSARVFLLCVVGYEGF